MAGPDPFADLRERALELERRVQLLEEENAALLEGHEDAVLLGLVAEQIHEQPDPDGILRAGLERISVLKDVPLCLCLSLRDRQATIVQHYANFTDEPPACPSLTLSAGLAGRLRVDSQFLTAEECAQAGLGPNAPFPMVALGALLIPFRSRAIPEGLFLFADDRGGKRIERSTAFLHRLADAMVARIDNVSLLGDLRVLAATLDRKVRERTQDLAKRNLELTGEVQERRRAEEALRESEEKFRTAFTTSPDSININRLADGVYLAVNEGFTRLTGWTEADVLGRSSLELNIWDDPSDRARLVAALQAGPVENLEARFRFKDGTFCDGLMSARIVRLRGETCILSVTRDVTALKRAQADRDRLAAQLGQAQKMEAVGRLAGGVAHDFNNLLTVILSCAEVLKRDIEGGGLPLVEDVEEILGSGERARDLTRQLLAFARKQVIAPVVLDLNAVVTRNERLLRRVLGEDVDLVVEVAPDLWPVRCDPGQMDQVLLNLAVNARDAMPDGGTLTVETRNVARPAGEASSVPQEPAGEWVQLCVRDTGTGMSPDVMTHIFEPFYTTKEQGHGTGLGLATVHGIVTQSSGHVHVRSEKGRGSIFEICLPRAPGEVRPSSGRDLAPGNGVLGGSETVLVVEDDARVRRVTTRSLEEAGYKVLAASDGAEALRVAKEEAGPLHLVVTDVVMPGLGGKAVAEELRLRYPKVRVLFVSGYPQESIAPQDLVENGVVFLPKPFTPMTLLARVRALLDAP